MYYTKGIGVFCIILSERRYYAKLNNAKALLDAEALGVFCERSKASEAKFTGIQRFIDFDLCQPMIIIAMFHTNRFRIY